MMGLENGMQEEKMKTLRKDKGYRGDASQFFIAGELCRRGLVAVVTMGNCPNTDILCSNSEGTKFVHIQVKTFRPGDKTCSVGRKAEKSFGDSFFWVLGGIPKPDQKAEFEYYIIPADIMAARVKAEFKHWVESPGKKKPHDPENTFRCIMMPPVKDARLDWTKEYKNRWDLIEKKLLS
jgi:hypothetical protein